MGQPRSSVCKLCRRAGQKLFLKGQRCYSPKCAFERKTYPPGPRGKERRRRPSDYSKQLCEKQKLRHIYGVSEEQFRRYVREAERMPGISGHNLLQLLERRLDNVVHRAGLANSRAQARQMVSHCHFLVNGRVVNIPSYLVKVGQQIQPKDSSKDLQPIEEALASTAGAEGLEWLAVNREERVVEIISLPEASEIHLEVDEQLVMEFYSR